MERDDINNLAKDAVNAAFAQALNDQPTLAEPKANLHDELIKDQRDYEAAAHKRKADAILQIDDLSEDEQHALFTKAFRRSKNLAPGRPMFDRLLKEQEGAFNAAFDKAWVQCKSDN